MDWLWPAAEKAGLPVALLCQDYLPKVAEVAERHPALRLLIDHFGRVRGVMDDAAYANIAEVAALARFPNVALKATGAPGESTDPYPFRNIHPYLRRLYDAFGPRRFFWGTDITRMPCPWRQCVTMFTEELPWLSGEELEFVMGRGVCEWIGWRLPD
jgi:predicted TIM-barrel fold metal-dependent hydrolase